MMNFKLLKIKARRNCKLVVEKAYHSQKVQESQKVVVQKFVAEYIERCKFSGWHLQKALYRLDDDEKVGDWAYDENDDLIAEKIDEFARAWLAYPNITIEKEKLYTVEIPNPKKDSLTLLEKLNDGTVVMTQTDVFPVDWRDHAEAQLTEAEIRKDFEWAWQWAKEVKR